VNSARRQTPRVVLTERDLDLLEDLVRLLFASADQLAERHYANRSPATAHRRMRQLRAGGYLVRHSRHLLDRSRPSVVYSLTPSGREEVMRRTPYLERTSNA
jgi:DNA-binding MarR family transcriptional regulator